MSVWIGRLPRRHSFGSSRRAKRMSACEANGLTARTKKTWLLFSSVVMNDCSLRASSLATMSQQFE